MTFYFYDLETSGINARSQRIMQFAGQRTNKNFEPIGEPHNWLVKLTDEILPDPEAVLITGITPQQTIRDGYSEAEFLQMFAKEVLQPDTVLTGFNSIRFDDEFMRHTLWRNFYDPYEWQWQDGRSKWDLLDVVRMIRALRPDGIEWPFEPMRARGESEHGQPRNTPPQNAKDNLVPSNRLELLTKANNISHEGAHDALSDVQATIALAKLLSKKQPKIFNYLLEMRDKNKTTDFTKPGKNNAFVYSSGRYSNKWHKTTIVTPIATIEHGGVLVYDLRQDPKVLAAMDDEQLKVAAFTRSDETEVLPLKVLKPNVCPAVAPVGVFNKDCQQRLGLNLATVEKNLTQLKSIKGFVERLGQLFTAVSEERHKTYTKESDPEFQLYDGFIDQSDKVKLREIRIAGPEELATLTTELSDVRLNQLLPRYKARNFPNALSEDEQITWQNYKKKRLVNGVYGQLTLQQYMKKLGELAQSSTEEKQFLLEELQLWAENITQDFMTET